MLFPNGLAGVWPEYAEKYVDRLPGFGTSRKASPPGVLPVASLEFGHGQ
jgi:hypothetical protein